MSAMLLKAESYYIMNCRVSKDLIDRLELYAALNNIADKDYEPEAGYPGQGRTFWMGLSGQY